VRRPEPDPRALVERAREGDPRARARLFSLVENEGPGAAVAVAELAPLAGQATVIGVTGPPGAGKSTLVARLARAARDAGQTVAVLAVDPSSPLTGGAVLGDRIRMQDLHGDPGAYIRSLATRGAMGGLARAAGDLALVADALGYRLVIVETVGAGQDEAEIAGVAPTVVLVEVPHLGDDVQAIKAGILEIADVFVVNKADREGADQAAATFRAMLSLTHRREGWNPPVLKTVATTGDGIPRLLETIQKHQAYLKQSGRLAAWRVDRARRQILDGVRDRLLARLSARVSAAELHSLAAAIAEHRADLEDVVGHLVEMVDQR
jgi:LAO/AO transport system kinase